MSPETYVKEGRRVDAYEVFRTNALRIKPNYWLPFVIPIHDDWPREASALSGLKLVLVGILVISAHFAVWSLIWPHAPKVALENYIMENLQAVSLFIGSFVFFVLSYRSSVVGIRVLFLGFGLLYLTFLMRELDLRQFEDLFAPLVVVNDPIKDYWLVAAWLFSALIFFRSARDTLKAFVNWIRSMPGRLMVIGGLFYLLADIFDKDIIGLSYEDNRFYEEFLELNATSFLIISAVLAILRTEGSTYNSSLCDPQSRGSAATRHADHLPQTRSRRGEPILPAKGE